MYLAELNQIDQVTQIHIVDEQWMLWDWGDAELTDEEKCVAYLRQTLGPDAKLVETREFDPEERFRERPAEIGGYYDYEGEYFISVQPHPDWEYNTEYHVWVAPVEHPNAEIARAAGLTIEEVESTNEDITKYWWNEDQSNWEALTDEG